MRHSVKSTFNLEDRSTRDDVLNLLFAQQLLAPLQQQLNMQDKSSSQVRRRLKALTHQLQILKSQHFSEGTEVEADNCLRLNRMCFSAIVMWCAGGPGAGGQRLPVLGYEKVHST